MSYNNSTSNEFTGTNGQGFINSIVKVDIERAANVMKRVFISGDSMTVTTTKIVKPENGKTEGSIIITVRVYDKNSGKSVSKRAGTGLTMYGTDNLLRNVLITQWGTNEGKNIAIKHAHMAKKDHGFSYGLATKSNGKHGINELLMEGAKTFISEMIKNSPKVKKAEAKQKPLTQAEIEALEAAQLAEIENATNADE